MIQAARFWARVDQSDPTGCWPWRGSIWPGRMGYGRVRETPRRCLMAHRVAFEFTFGAIKGGLLVCHRCDNPPCCNPAHLFLGTHRDNVHDCMQKQRRARLHGATHPMAKLGEPEVLQIRQRHSVGERMKALAIEYSVTVQTICHIVNRKTWGHI